MTNRQLERVVKGFASYRRLQILQLLVTKPNLSVSEIADKTKTDFRNTSQHLQKMVSGGLVYKKQQGNEVLHYLSPRGKTIAKFVSAID